MYHLYKIHKVEFLQKVSKFIFPLFLPLKIFLRKKKKGLEPLLFLPKIYIHTSPPLMKCGTRGELLWGSTWHHELNLCVNIKALLLACNDVTVFPERVGSASYRGLLPSQSNPQQDSSSRGQSDECTGLIFVLEYE